MKAKYAIAVVIAAGLVMVGYAATARGGANSACAATQQLVAGYNAKVGAEQAAVDATWQAGATRDQMEAGFQATAALKSDLPIAAELVMQHPSCFDAELNANAAAYLATNGKR